MKSSPSSHTRPDEQHVNQLREILHVIEHVNEQDSEAAYILTTRLYHILGPDYYKGLNALIQEHGLAPAD